MTYCKIEKALYINGYQKDTCCFSEMQNSLVVSHNGINQLKIHGICLEAAKLLYVFVKKLNWFYLAALIEQITLRIAFTLFKNAL